MTSACPACDRDTLRTRSIAHERAVGGVAVQGQPLTVRTCDCGHVEVPRSLGQAAREAAQEALPVARSGFRRERCASCGTTLTMPARRTTRAVTATPDDGPVVTLRFDLPMRRCPDCGLDQLPARAKGSVEVALAGLLQSAAEEVAGLTPMSELGPWQRLSRRLRGPTAR